jgi:hypothetical protein
MRTSAITATARRIGATRVLRAVVVTGALS